MNRILIFILLFGAAAVSRARAVEPWTLAELTKRADVICTGIPLKIEVIEVRETGDLLNFNVPPAKHVTVARIKVVAREKGALPGEIEMRYPTYAQQPLSLEGEDHHDHIKLEKGRRYRFYLKWVEGELWYVGALDGEANDGAAVQPDEKSADDNPVASGNIGGKLNRNLEKKRVELTVTDGKSKQTRLVRGVIEKVGAETVTGLVDGTENTPAKQETFSKAGISKMELLPDSHPAQ